jgi:hypothetical protein
MAPIGHGRIVIVLTMRAIIGQKKTADIGSADFLPYLQVETKNCA